MEPSFSFTGAVGYTNSQIITRHCESEKIFASIKVHSLSQAVILDFTTMKLKIKNFDTPGLWCFILYHNNFSRDVTGTT